MLYRRLNQHTTNTREFKPIHSNTFTTIEKWYKLTVTCVKALEYQVIVYRRLKRSTYRTRENPIAYTPSHHAYVNRRGGSRYQLTHDAGKVDQGGGGIGESPVNRRKVSHTRWSSRGRSAEGRWVSSGKDEVMRGTEFTGHVVILEEGGDA